MKRELDISNPQFGARTFFDDGAGQQTKDLSSGGETTTKGNGSVKRSNSAKATSSGSLPALNPVTSFDRDRQPTESLSASIISSKSKKQKQKKKSSSPKSGDDDDDEDEDEDDECVPVVSGVVLVRVL
jgi:hypothetical protein